MEQKVDEQRMIVLAKFANGESLNDEELTIIGKIFAAKKEVMNKAKKFASAKLNESERKAEHERLMQEHKISVVNMVNNFAAGIVNVEFQTAKDVRDYVKKELFDVMPKVPTMKGKGSAGNNSRKPITDVNNLTEGSSNFYLWQFITGAKKGIDRKGLIGKLAAKQPDRKSTLVKQAVSIGCNTLPVVIHEGRYFTAETLKAYQETEAKTKK